MATYFAVIHKEPDSDYGVSFPDIPGCITAGSTLAEVDSMARDALSGHLEILQEEGMDRPSPSSYEEVHEEHYREEHFVAVILVTIPEKIKRVRVNVSIPELDLAIIDDAAAARSLDRSAFLAMAGKHMAQGKCAA